MPLTLIAHTSLITLSVGLIYSWTANPHLSTYNLQLAGVLAIIYFFSRFLKLKPKYLSLTTITTFLSLILLMIFSTGSLDSPFFFLLDILLFALALFFEPAQALITSFILTLVFLVSSKLSLSTSQAINLASLILITPLAVVFGKKLAENQKNEESISKEETQTLLWIATKAKPSLTEALETTSEVISSNLLPFRLQEKIKKAHKDIMDLHKSANSLEIIIDKETD
jgi:hypothetical protein